MVWPTSFGEVLGVSPPDAGAGEATRRLRLLRGVTWEWREDAPDDTSERPGMGVIAQEVETVFPELVELDERGIRAVEYDGLVPPLLQAVTELDARLRGVKNALQERGHTVADPEGTPRDRTHHATDRVARVAGEELRTELDPDEIEKVFPQLVILNDEGEREVAYEGLVGLLIEAVRELDARVSGLERGLEAGPEES